MSAIFFMFSFLLSFPRAYSLEDAFRVMRPSDCGNRDDAENDEEEHSDAKLLHTSITSALSHHASYRQRISSSSP
jgi:hypothetical protein